MPQELRIRLYSVYFLSNENDPFEPVHVHVSEGKASSNARLKIIQKYEG